MLLEEMEMEGTVGQRSARGFARLSHNPNPACRLDDIARFHVPRRQQQANFILHRLTVILQQKATNSIGTCMLWPTWSSAAYGRPIEPAGEYNQ